MGDGIVQCFEFADEAAVRRVAQVERARRAIEPCEFVSREHDAPRDCVDVSHFIEGRRDPSFVDARIRIGRRDDAALHPGAQVPGRHRVHDRASRRSDVGTRLRKGDLDDAHAAALTRVRMRACDARRCVATAVREHDDIVNSVRESRSVQGPLSSQCG